MKLQVAKLLQAQGELDLAEKLYREALSTFKEGELDEQYQCECSLGSLLMTSNKYEEAEILLTESLEGRNFFKQCDDSLQIWSRYAFDLYLIYDDHYYYTMIILARKALKQCDDSLQNLYPNPNWP